MVEQKTISPSQISFVKKLRKDVGYNDAFQGNLEEMSSKAASRMIRRLLWTRNEKTAE